MICVGPLTPQQMKRSQNNLNYFNLVNGLSYTCLGTTVMILLAIRIGCSDAVVSALGAMIYFGVTLLPMGRVFTAHVGAARTQGLCWIARNMAALMVASSAIWHLMGIPCLPTVTLVLGSYIFCGFRAAGCVMSQPLIGEICTEEDRPKLLGQSSGIFYISGCAVLCIVIPVLKRHTSIMTLFWLIVAGSALGITASHFVSRIDETEVLRDSSRRPIMDDLKEAFANRALRKLMLVGFMNSLAMIMIMPISYAVLKRAYGFSDTGAMIFSMVQFLSSAIFSVVIGKMSAKLGPRRSLLLIYVALLFAVPLWMLMPANGHALLSLMMIGAVFTLIGAADVGFTNAVGHYFLQTVPDKNRVAASILQSVMTGAGAGITGILLSGWLLGATQSRIIVTPGSAAQLAHSYNVYFVISMLALLPGVFLILRLTPLPMEKRRIHRFWGPHKL